MTRAPDPTLDVLLDLDGQVLVVDPEGGHWVRFVVTRVPVTAAKPHGLDYSLTLHGPDGERLVGFDNAHRADRHHPADRQQRGEPHDHRHRLGRHRLGRHRLGRHRLGTVKSYDYQDAATLLADFWAAVDRVLRERGVIP